MSFPPAVEQWRSLVAKYFPADQVDNALAIMQRESGGNPSAHNPGTAIVPEDSWGLFQINLNAHPQMATGVTDGETNIQYAWQLFQGQGWAPWYTNAKLLGLLDGATAGGGDGVGPEVNTGAVLALVALGVAAWWILE